MAKKEETKNSAMDDLLAQFQNPKDYAQKNVEHNESEGRKSDFERLPSGKTVLRFLPGIENEPFFYHIKYHWLGNKVVYDRQQLGPDEYNPISQYASQLWNASIEPNGNPRDGEHAKKLFAKDKYIYNVLVRGTGDEEDRVTVIETGKTIHKKLMKLMADGEINDITDAFNGRDIVITRTGEGLNTEYEVRERESESWIVGGPDSDKKEVRKKIEAIYSQRKNLAGLVNYPTYEEAEIALEQYKKAHETVANHPEDTSEKKAAAKSEYTKEEEDVFNRLEQDLESIG